MKLSLILVSVNIAATLPIAAAGVASAADQAKSDKADWLKSSLAQMDATPTQKSGLRARALSLSVPSDTAGTVRPRSVKLRPFVPGRKLPSQHDLDVQFIAQNAKYASVRQAPELIEQTAMMAPSAEPLSGRVQEIYPAAQHSVATYGNVGYVKQSSSRVVPGQVPSAPGQIRQFKGAKRTKYVPTQQNQITQPTRPVQMPEEQAWTADYPTLGTSISQQQPSLNSSPFQPSQSMQRFAQPTQMQSSSPFTSPGITPDEQSIIDRMVAQTHARNQAAEGSQSANLSSAAGPPPFPLNLLPADSLKSIISGMHRSPQNAQAPSSYFGSWHGNAQHSNLSAGGFQLHAPTRSTVRIASASRSMPHTTASQARHAQLESRSHSQTHTIAQLRRLPPQEIRVAAYPPYPRIAGAY